MIESELKQKDFSPKTRFITPFEPALMPTVKLGASDLSAWVIHLYRILANHHAYESYNEVMKAVVSLGCSRYKFDNAFVVRRISEQVYELQSYVSASETYFIGQHLSANDFPYFALHEEKRVVIEGDVSSKSSINQNKAYNLSESRPYLGINLELSSSERGIVCFMSSSENDHQFDDDDMVLLELMAEGIACMTDLQKVRTQRKTEDLAIFASGSITSLEEYQMSAELPEGLGISGKVVDVLKRRIGHSSLSIDNIAEELNLSKRTLQRRLQQQGISFAELRDRVRFHYSIDFLVKQQISIDRISSTLDFSDRTSFTNAFKRWTGLSPSTFRKVYRDYV